MQNSMPGHEALAQMGDAQLYALAEQIRKDLIESVSASGGHLASNLGVVELTLALHSVFHTPYDKLVFDVGHQSYVHKMLTGRWEGIKQGLRKQGGVSGFPRIQESEHDVFSTGHSSTAISAALGLARARDARGERHSVVAVVGDGAMTGGMCYEALNDAGQNKTPIIVVLNDNEMSISQNVGALSMYLTRLRQSDAYRHTKRAVRGNLEKVPAIGKPLARGIELLKGIFKYLLVNGQFFQALGFSYYGPIDGHDVSKLKRALSRARSEEGPVLVHVVTKKGRGYAPAEDRPDRFHGIAPFYVDTGLPVNSGPMQAGSVAANALLELAKQDGRVCAISAAMVRGTGLSPFGQAFPNRMYDVGIAEGHAVTLAAGLAAGGMKPYFAVYSTFLQRGYDQILHDVCLDGHPVTFLIDRAGLTGEDGATHQGIYDLSYLRTMPGMTILSPRDEEELKDMVVWSLNHTGPLAIRYGKWAEPLGEDYPRRPISPGSWEMLQAGRHGMVLAVGAMVKTALEARQVLKRQGLDIGVVNARSVKPLDGQMLAELDGMAAPLFTLEENVLLGGFGGAVAEHMAEKGHKARPVLLGVPDVFIEQGTISQQRVLCKLSPEQVAEALAGHVRGDGFGA